MQSRTLQPLDFRASQVSVCNFCSQFPFNDSCQLVFTSRHLSRHVKISKITPVDKGGEEIDPSNYSPISTLSTLTQILEKLICKHLASYLGKKTILYEFQFLFRKGDSTSQAITESAENLQKAVDHNMYSCWVFLDFSKALDTVNHKMLSKLPFYGIMGLPLQHFTSYLTNIEQYISIANNLSSMQTITSGAPQGSSLGLVLFFLFT